MSPIPSRIPERLTKKQERDGVPASVAYKLYLDAGAKIPLIMFVNLLLGLLTALLLWGHTPDPLLLAWLVLLGISLLFRGALALNYRRARPETLGRWQGSFVAASLFAGSVWGMAGLLLELHLTEHHQGFAAFILGGMAAGSLVTNSAIRWNYPAFMVPTLLPLTGYFFYLGDLAHTLMGVMIGIFMTLFGNFATNVRKLAIEQQLLLSKQRESEQRLKDITSSIGEGVFVVDDEGRLQFINQEGERLLGWRYEELEGSDIHQRVHVHENGSDAPCIVQKSHLDNRTVHTENDFFRRKNGEQFPVSLTASPIRTEQGTAGTVIVFADITKRKAMEEELARLARYDALTCLFNRGSFDRHFTREAKRAYRYGRSLSLLILDIDFFKKVNDTYGHRAGDKALKSVADIIRSSIRSSDIAARYGGEEFAIISPETEIEQALILAERLRSTIQATEIPLSETQRTRLTVSIGAGSCPGDTTMEALLEATDRALYQAKMQGRNRVERVS